jgi:hypothetical protein
MLFGMIVGLDAGRSDIRTQSDTGRDKGKPGESWRRKASRL